MSTMGGVLVGGSTDPHSRSSEGSTRRGMDNESQADLLPLLASESPLKSAGLAFMPKDAVVIDPHSLYKKRDSRSPIPVWDGRLYPWRRIISVSRESESIRMGHRPHSGNLLFPLVQRFDRRVNFPLGITLALAPVTVNVEDAERPFVPDPCSIARATRANNLRDQSWYRSAPQSYPPHSAVPRPCPERRTATGAPSGRILHLLFNLPIDGRYVRVLHPDRLCVRSPACPHPVVQRPRRPRVGSCGLHDVRNTDP